MNQKTRTAVAVVIIAFLFVAAVAGSYGLSLYAINRSQHQWCDTLSLITANPAHPTTANGKLFYDRLKVLERRFSCD